MNLDVRVKAHDPQRRWAEAPAPSGWRELRPVPALARARLSLRSLPDYLAAQVTEALLGERLEWLADEGDWSWVRTVHDRYLGWTPRSGLLLERPRLDADLTVTAPRGHVYTKPRVSAPIEAELSWGARLRRGAGEAVTEQGRTWWPVQLTGGGAGWVQSVVCQPREWVNPTDFALEFLGTPYVWGGRSAWGIDCSGLTQLAYAAVGRALPRDADQQEAVLEKVAQPQRGDLAFFEGHVGLMLDDRQMVHANATAMSVTVDTLGEGEYPARLLRGLRGYGRWRS